MENEKGIIASIENNEVIVEFYRSSACEKCGACMMAKDTGKMMIKLPYTKEVEVGDEVTVDVKRNFYLLSSVLLYIVPLIVLVASIFIGVAVLEGDNAQVLAAVLGVVLSFGSYFAIRLFNKKFAGMKKESMTYYKA